MIQLEPVHQQSHLLAGTGVADCLVIHIADAIAVGFRQRAEATRGVEGFVELAVDLDLFETLECEHVDLRAIDDSVTQVAVFIDHAVGRPGQRVLEHVVRVLRERADAELH